MFAIDADALEQELNRIYDKYMQSNDNYPIGTPYGGRVVVDIVRHFRNWGKKNGVDAVPVVRCEHCFFYGRNQEEAQRLEIPIEEYCALHQVGFPKDGFCNYGKPRGGGINGD